MILALEKSAQLTSDFSSRGHRARWPGSDGELELSSNPYNLLHHVRKIYNKASRSRSLLPVHAIARSSGLSHCPFSGQRSLYNMHCPTLLSLLATGSALVSAFPANSEAAASLDILTGRSIGSACSTPVYYSVRYIFYC